MSHNISGFVVFESDLMKASAEKRARWRFKVLNNGFVFVDAPKEEVRAFATRDAVWVDTSYHGGVGEQSARIIRHSLPALIERFDTAKNGNINAALHTWNPGFPSEYVQEQCYRDLFEYVGLNLIRSNDDLLLGGKDQNALPPNVTLERQHGVVIMALNLRPDGDIPKRVELEAFDERLESELDSGAKVRDVHASLSIRGDDSLSKCFAITERLLELLERHFNSPKFRFELDVQLTTRHFEAARILVVQWTETEDARIGDRLDNI